MRIQIQVIILKCFFLPCVILQILEQQRWNLKNLSRGLNLPKPGLN